MRAVICDPAASRRAAIAAELTRQGTDVEERDEVAGLDGAADGASIVVLGVADGAGAEDALEVCRRLRAETDEEEPVVVLIGGEPRLSAADALEAGASYVWSLAEDATVDDVGVRIALARHVARLQAEHIRVGGEFALLRQSLDLTGTGFVLTDPRLDDDPVVYANQSFYDITGYSEDEVLGFNCRFLQGPATDPAQIDRIRASLATERPVSATFVNYRRDGSRFFNEVHIASVRDHRGEVVRRVGVQLDVTAYHEQGRELSREQEARKDAEAREQRSTFLADASPTFDASLDDAAILRSLGDLALGRLGDAALVWAARGAHLRPVVARADDSALTEALAGAELAIAAGSAAAHVAADGRARVHTGPSLAVNPEVDAAVGATGRPRWIFAPLQARGRVLGLLGVATSSPTSESEADVALAEDLVGRASLAFDNAQLYRHQVDATAALQSSFLPPVLPDVPGLELAVHYQPADVALDLGGDFYDAVDLGRGTLALTVGDVTGKGAAAAALTSLCRHTLRGAWAFQADPAEVLRALNRALIAQRSDVGLYATAVICVLEPAGDGYDVLCVTAGHPAPRIARRDGSVERLAGGGTLLGWREPLPLGTGTAHLGPGDTLVAYTDGVASGTSAGPIPDSELEQILMRTSAAELDVVVDAIRTAAEDAPAPRDDDVVVLAARPGGRRTMRSWDHEATAVSIGEIRRDAAGFLRDAGLRGWYVERVELAIAEALANVVVHAYPDATGEVRVNARIVPETGAVTVLVEDDGGGPKPRDDSPGAGFGLDIIRAMSSEVELRQRPGGGTSVEMRFL